VPSAVSSASRFSRDGRRRERSTFPTNPLFEFRLRLEHCPAKPSRIAEANAAPPMDSGSLQHIRGSKVHLTRALPSRYVPPSGFGYPLDGFLPSNPRRPCFVPAALLGFTLRSFLLPEGIRPSRSGRTHLPFPRRMTRSRSGRAVAATAVPGFRPFREYLAGEHAISAPRAGCSLGFFPFGVNRRRPGSGFHPNSSHALSQGSSLTARPEPAPRSVNQPSPGPATD
jgi:hypothetical protein